MTNEQTAVLLAGWVRRLEWCLCEDYEKEVRGQYEDLRLSLSAAIMEIKDQVVMLSRPSGAKHGNDEKRRDELPDGYRVVNDGETIQPGDLYYDLLRGWQLMEMPGVYNSKIMRTAIRLKDKGQE